jgi:2-methylcitrate dehydratase PrpD
MTLDDEVDDAYPARWLGRVTVELRDGSKLCGQIDEPRGDPGNTLSREELEAKFRELAAFREGATSAEASRIIDWVWNLEGVENVGRLF